jgi:hypothetical protein
MDIFKYYAIDWFAMSFSFIALYLIGEKNKYAFVFFITGNALWLLLGIILNSLAMIIGNSIFLITNIRGLIKWFREDIKLS